MLKIAQVGCGGFGKIHLNRIERLAEMGRVELVAGADPAGPGDHREVPCYNSLGELLSHHTVDIVSIATPIGTHMALATQALESGAHVMLEKPPVTSLDDFWALNQIADSLDLCIQVGFQSLGSGGIARMIELAEEELGELVSVQVWGMWQRYLAYFKRSEWAGHRVLDGRRVADGVCTNALAHSIATANRIQNVLNISDITDIETELYHGFDTQSDDTSWVRINLHSVVPIDVSLTLCGPRQESPTVTLVGTRGRAEFRYTEDTVILQRADGTTATETFPRRDLLENLIDHIESDVPLIAPLRETVGFMAVLEATQTASDPVPIPQEFLTWEGEGDDAHPVPRGIEYWQHYCLSSGLGYYDAEVPWADPKAKSIWTPPTRNEQ